MLTLMIQALESNLLDKATAFLPFLWVVFVMYVGLSMAEWVPAIANWFLYDYRGRPRPTTASATVTPEKPKVVV